MLLWKLVNGSSSGLCNAIYDLRSYWFDIAFHGTWTKTNANIRWQFQLSWWNSAVTKSVDDSLEHLIRQLIYYISDLYLKYEFPLRTYYCNSSTSLSLQYGQSCFINHWTGRCSDIQQFDLCNFAMSAFGSKFFPIQLVPCSEGWQTTWWQMIHMMPGLSVLSIPQGI